MQKQVNNFLSNCLASYLCGYRKGITRNSSNINDVIRAILNSYFFTKILQTHTHTQRERETQTQTQTQTHTHRHIHTHTHTHTDKT